MTYRLVCDTCSLDREIDDRVTAHRIARDHEGEFPDHLVSFHERWE